MAPFEAVIDSGALVTVTEPFTNTIE